MPAILEIKAFNLKEWQRLAQKTARAFDAADTIRNVEVTLNSRFKRVSSEMFKSEGSFGADGRWAPLSSDYAERKAKLFPGKTILRRTDRMFRSFTSRHENVGFGARVGDGFIYKFGSLVPYAEFHAKGGANLPARKVLNPTVQQLRGVAASIGRTVVEGLFSRRWFDEKGGGLQAGFTLTAQGFDSINVP